MRENNGFGSTKAIYHQLDDIEIFPVTKEQLDGLEKGSASDLFLEFAIGLSSIFASFLCSLIILDFKDNSKAFVVYTIICSISGLASAILFFLWRLFRKERNSIIKKIREQKVAE